jgi:hypothetical protein
MMSRYKLAQVQTTSLGVATNTTANSFTTLAAKTGTHILGKHILDTVEHM